MAVSSGIERVIKSGSLTPCPEFDNAVDSACVFFVCAFCFVVLVAEEVHPLGFRLILDKRWRCPFFQLAALVDVIAAPQRNLAAFQSQPLTVTLLHAYGFAHHAPGRVSMP